MAVQQQPTDEKGTHIDRTSQLQEINAQGTYAEKTDRIQAWVQIIRAVVPFIWAIVILVVLIPLVGQIFIAIAFPDNNHNDPINTPGGEVVIEHNDGLSKVNKAVNLTLVNARKSAEIYASKELDVWVDELMDGVDDSFLDWYFGYFN